MAWKARLFAVLALVAHGQALAMPLPASKAAGHRPPSSGLGQYASRVLCQSSKVDGGATQTIGSHSAAADDASRRAGRNVAIGAALGSMLQGCVRAHFPP